MQESLLVGPVQPHGWAPPVTRRPWHPSRPLGCWTLGHIVSVQHSAVDYPSGTDYQSEHITETEVFLRVRLHRRPGP